VPFVWTGTNKILSYDPARGYLHSKTLRWSWGAMRGRPEQDWQPYLYDTPLPTLLPEIVAGGFDGIWVDRNGYTDSGRALERSLRSLVHVRPLVSSDKRFVFFDLTSYARALRAAHPAADVRQLRRSALEPLRLSPEQGYAPQLAPQISLGPAAGFDALEQVTLPETNALLIAGPRLVTWRWTTQPTATLTLTNPSTAARSVQLRAVLQSAGDKPAKLDVQFPDGSVQHLTVTSKGVALRRTLLLKAGSSTVILSDHGPPYVERETTRSVYLRVAADVTDSSVGRYGSPPPLYGCASALPTHDCKPRPFEDFATPPAG
jgi:phosphoglycerol transferase